MLAAGGKIGAPWLPPARSPGGLGSLTAAGALGLSYAFAESRAYTLRRFELPVLPAGTAPLRVLHLSDLHLTPRNHREVSWVRSLNGLEPDLVVNTGDNLASLQGVPTVLDALTPLLERPGVFVLGSNDYYAPKVKNPARYLSTRGTHRRVLGRPLPTSDLVDGLTSAGWLNLTNRRAALTVHGVRTRLRGRRRPAPAPRPLSSARRRRPRAERPDHRCHARAIPAGARRHGQ
jgi:predicted MPP superfamily phosphohydrolase